MTTLQRRQQRQNQQSTGGVLLFVRLWLVSIILSSSSSFFTGTTVVLAFSSFAPPLVVVRHQQQQTYYRTSRSSRVVALYAITRGLPPPPPPPPPPPSVVVDEQQLNVIQQTIHDLQKVVEQQFSRLPDVPVEEWLSKSVGTSLRLPELSQEGLLSNSLTSSLSTQLSTLDVWKQQQMEQIGQNVLQQSAASIMSIKSFIEDSDATASTIFAAPIVKSIVASFQSAALLWFNALVNSPSLLVLVSSVAVLLTMTLINAVLSASSPPTPPSVPYPLLKYDADAARQYFNRRLPMVFTRGLEVAIQSLQFGVSLLLDKLQDKVAVNEMQRGRELATLLTRLGPTFIKVGQSLSIRTDLLSPAYIRGLETLQDQVPSFSTTIAKRILETEWGKPITEVLLDDLSVEPVAAASLGQVYKSKLRSTGEDVAIKVQRPDILVKIALDMYLLRMFGAVLKRVFTLNTDTVGTVDAWGVGFIDELDYIQEGINGQMFSTQIMDTPLRDVVFAPAVLQEYSTRTVLVTSWVNGERLDRSNSADISVLCSIAMNTYLTMLLELGMLHCDPHPGNLLRTPEGKLCILDFGMVTRINKDLQLTLIEHMAHLTSADYEEIPRDLLLLGFVPEDKADVIGDSGVVEVLADIYGAWTSGGGVAAINVNKVIAQLQDLTAQKGNLFRIPPYFAYIAKSFSVLEGIGLSNDPKYSIINECLPYVSKRLLTDKDKMGPALSTFIFGPEKQNADRIVDYKRVEQLVEGFGEYSTSASGALLGKTNMTRSVLLEDAADQVLDLIFTEEETPLQLIVLEQMAKIISASGRTIWTRLRERSGTLPTGRTRLGTLVDPLGIWRTSPLVRTNELDERTVETTRKLLSLMRRQIERSDNPLFNSMSREETLEFASILVRKVWSKRSGVVQTSNRFARMLIQLTADQLERGERDTRRLPRRDDPPPAVLSSSPVTNTDNNNLPLEGGSDRPPAEKSQRLEGARRLLNEIREQQEAEQLAAAASTSIEMVQQESHRLNEARRLLDEINEQQLLQSKQSDVASNLLVHEESQRLAGARKRLHDIVEEDANEGSSWLNEGSSGLNEESLSAPTLIV